MLHDLYRGELYTKMNTDMSIAQQQKFCSRNEGKRPKWFNLKNFDDFGVSEDDLSKYPVVPRHLVIANVGPEFWSNVGNFAIPLRIKKSLSSFFSKSYKNILDYKKSIEKENGECVFVLIPEDEFSNTGFLVSLVSIEDLKKSREEITNEWFNDNIPKKPTRGARVEMLRSAYLIVTGRTDTK